MSVAGVLGLRKGKRGDWKYNFFVLIGRHKAK